MILITFELKPGKDGEAFYKEAQAILKNDKFEEINPHTFIANNGNAISIADKLYKSGVYQKGCKNLYYASTLSKK